ncbi:Protein farnesyltransferase/geranylgeranyltransferase type-1 subunit alpha [Tolypocladium ophioglossoides CBS 100239]|uniref:Protein farnesyltransferase/geranylgeranyltransferase type-1 subunit alpha n=1 Tax=Tolypocladium ophioglossoides (strain CBS 100239) TaxID=1163406 RepID=A0A0L0NDA5_TOLOC|nr:Protein farnesyltransferase/geranylgeranyltransferase type-1 subunit alpha [Tolypocladium ophioglossoides CBS 100239]
MPPKPKGGAKANNLEPKAPEAAPETVDERNRQRFYQTNPIEKQFEEVGLPGLTPAEKKTYIHSRLLLPVAEHKVPLSSKTEREFWKQVTKEGLPIRRLRKDYSWGRDKSGRDLGSYKLEDFEQRSLKQARLTALDILHLNFLAKRDIARRNAADVAPEDIEDEKKRRTDMAALKRELYGEITGPLANDPEWDDVIPIPQNEPEDALAKIAYPDDYAEAVSYLRAVMAIEECSPRCLRLTELVIALNPAHYTVWLYRFNIISALRLSIPDEITWLDEVALKNLKNYQIWHHRQLLMDYYYPMIFGDDEDVKRLAKSETDFIAMILAEDTKNYHVWSYRQYLVEKLGLWTPSELGATQSMIEDDVRNNSAWSHRFFVVFSDPTVSTADLPPTAHDPKVPDATIDREVAYAKDKMVLAPQNQSGWNYLRGVLAKGSRSLTAVGEFAEQFVSGLGQEDERVQSSHALDVLAEVYQDKGDKDKAKLCLQRLWEKWDPVREGYWKYRASEMERAA